MNLAIIILAKERPLQLQAMIESIERVTENPTIVICDNASTQPEMIKYLSTIDGKYGVIRNSENLGFEGLNPGLALIKEPYFFISDPDIILNKDMPKNWQDLMVSAIEEYNVPKIGVALSLCNVPHGPFGKRIKIAEGVAKLGDVSFRCMPDPGNYALIDTTFCLLRRDTYPQWRDGLVLRMGQLIAPLGHISQENYNPKYFKYPIRIGGRFEAIHTGWSMKEDYPTDYEYYKNNCNLVWASTTQVMKGYGL